MSQFDDLAIPMTYQDAVAQLYARIPEVIKPGLERIQALTNAMGNPETNAPIVHVVGTNGKTSTTLMAAALLQAFNLTVGSYTSPHLQVVNERIRVNGEPISDNDLLRITQLLTPFLAVADGSGHGTVSYFEALTGLAFAYFADVPVNVAVLEAGMGGKWDATNVGHNDVVIITPIAMDHPELGDTLVAKAKEKAAVIDPESTVICAPQHPDVMAIIRERCDAVSATLKVYGEDFELAGRELAVGGQMIDIRGVGGETTEIFLPLLGHHQAINATLAYAAVEALFDFEAELNAELVREGFVHAKSPGRLERIYRDGEPLVLLDGAHNPAGMETLAQTLKQDFSFERTVLLIGMVADKDIETSAAIIADLADVIVVTTPPSSRAGDPARLCDVLKARGKDVHCLNDVEAAFDAATNLTRSDHSDAIVVTGSLYLVGAIRDLLAEPPA
ncbi:folylpolyglutamate synthase/dihydrofolate synthase family protein [Stomatohabitans albus]|uniref:bifunctional folylpolyglutamate synthase/dihydrofolate synthase n=1 Tax=Stomatohabitans albus TaxID=3110766 RepID=UPI00300D796A